jgi:hypothetical protein
MIGASPGGEQVGGSASWARGKTMTDRVWLKPRKRLVLLERMMRALAGPTSFISVEGNLAGWQFDLVSKVASESRGALKRQTSLPMMDFAVLPLRQDTIGPLLKQISQLGFAERICHILIEKDGALAFSACDNFHPECIFAQGAESRVLLDDLIAEGVAELLVFRSGSSS